MQLVHGSLIVLHNTFDLSDALKSSIAAERLMNSPLKTCSTAERNCMILQKYKICIFERSVTGYSCPQVELKHWASSQEVTGTAPWHTKATDLPFFTLLFSSQFSCQDLRNICNTSHVHVQATVVFLLLRLCWPFAFDIFGLKENHAICFIWQVNILKQFNFPTNSGCHFSGPQHVLLLGCWEWSCKW